VGDIVTEFDYELFAIRYATVTRDVARALSAAIRATGRCRWIASCGWQRAAAERLSSIPALTLSEKRKRTFLRGPVEALAALGIDANAAEDVILIHLHYDHVGNFDRFPKARFHLQERELAYATGRYMHYPRLSHSFEVDQHDIDFLTGFANVLAEAVAISARTGVLQNTIERMKVLVEEKDRLLEQKKVLAEELQHRVRNNLQLVYAMLSKQLDDTPDAARQRSIKAISRRISTLAQVYDHLFGNEMTRTTDFGGYVESLCIKG
jgi:two-component sensor histidine kinase